MQKPLFLIVKRKWFDLIKVGEKTTEFRDATEYWEKRILNKNFSHVVFQMGYSKNAPRLEMEISDIRVAIRKGKQTIMIDLRVGYS